MNRNKKIRKKMMTGLAVGMAGIMGAMPVYAADNSKAVTKEETVYVNAKADGSKTKVTVSDWLKNAGVEAVLKDQSDLTGIVNVKGDETFENQNGAVTWNTEGKDIYYQGTSSKELPVEVKLQYFLDGKEMEPSELVGKSGKLKIKIHYKNNAKKEAKIQGRKEEMYCPFVMMTGMILPEEKFTNVVIDNGKVISDGDRNIVLGVGMPGMKESLGLNDEDAASAIEDIHLPESLEVTADVTDFSMSSTYTVALSDLLEDLKLDDTKDLDSVMDSLNELEDAALKLVNGSKELSNGVEKLGASYDTFDKGIGTLQEGIQAAEGGTSSLTNGIQDYTKGADALNAGIQKYMGKDGELQTQVTEYVDGVNKVVKGVEDYTSGTVKLADGVKTYVAGEEQIAKGAEKLSELQTGLGEVKKAISTLNAAVDGKGSTSEDLYAASKALADGTKKLNASLQAMDQLMVQVDHMTAVGKEMADQAGKMSQAVQTQVMEPTENMLKAGSEMMNQMQTLAKQLEQMKAGCEKIVKSVSTKLEQQVNAQIEQKNAQIASVEKSAQTANAKIDAAISELNTEIAKAEANGNSETANALKAAVQKLSGAKVSADTIQPMEKVHVGEIPMELPIPDFGSMTGMVSQMQKEYEAIQKAMSAIEPQLKTMNQQLAQISTWKEKLPEKPMQQLKNGVAELDAGMQKLNGAMGSLSSNVGQLDEKTNSLPDAVKGMEALQKGLGELTKANPILLQGAEALKENASTLVTGVHTLSGGTEKLRTGLGTLGTELSSGASKLSMNSDALRNGATKLLGGTNQLVQGAGKLKSASGQMKSGIHSLQDGALKLKDGTVEFNEKGIKKLQEAADDLLGSLLDRVDALTSDSCSYDSYAGKSEDMDGSVKFIIETEAIE